MKKKRIVHMLAILMIFIASIIVIDSLQAVVFKRSPIFSIRYNALTDDDSYIDRGILIDTYYCVKEKDIVTVEWHFKVNKFTCPME